MTNDFSLPNEFWTEFVDIYWEKNPRLMRQVFESQIVSPEELFNTLARMSMRGPWDRFWVSDKQEPKGRNDFRFVSLDDWGPKTSDGSFTAFFERLALEFDHRPFGINLQRLQTVNPELWCRFRNFVAGLNRCIGSIPRRWDIDTFFGTYRATPFGIHKDNASVFAIGILGKRKYLLWPEDYFSPDSAAIMTPDLEKIEPHIKHAVQFDLEPGDMVYWPSTHWHVILSDGRPSAVVQLTSYFGHQSSASLGSIVERLLQQQLGTADSTQSYPNPLLQSHDGSWANEGGNCWLPPSLRQAIQALQQLVNSGAVERELLQVWLKQTSASGFPEIPPADDTAELAYEDTIIMDPRYPIAWTRFPDNTLAMAANGLVYKIADTPGVVPMLRELAACKRARVGELIERHASTEAEEEHLSQVILSLYNARGFRRIPVA
jgi:ribosomal protein L16 Arg81 hydroxylase